MLNSLVSVPTRPAPWGLLVRSAREQGILYSAEKTKLSPQGCSWLSVCFSRDSQQWTQTGTTVTLSGDSDELGWGSLGSRTRMPETLERRPSWLAGWLDQQVEPVLMRSCLGSGWCPCLLCLHPKPQQLSGRIYTPRPRLGYSASNTEKRPSRLTLTF